MAGSFKHCFGKWPVCTERPLSKTSTAPSLLQDASAKGASKPLGICGAAVAEEKDGIALGYMRRKRPSDMQLCVGGQFLDFVSLKDAPGADDEGVDRGGGEMGP